ncbi:UNVERIFIED_CONTAM: hypothetical protein NCL1_33228 [Trichonephila clavipes]
MDFANPLTILYFILQYDLVQNVGEKQNDKLLIATRVVVLLKFFEAEDFLQRLVSFQLFLLCPQNSSNHPSKTLKFRFGGYQLHYLQLDKSYSNHSAEYFIGEGRGKKHNVYFRKYELRILYSWDAKPFISQTIKRDFDELELYKQFEFQYSRVPTTRPNVNQKIAEFDELFTVELCNMQTFSRSTKALMKDFRTLESCTTYCKENPQYSHVILKALSRVEEKRKFLGHFSVLGGQWIELLATYKSVLRT